MIFQPGDPVVCPANNTTQLCVPVRTRLLVLLSITCPEPGGMIVTVEPALAFLMRSTLPAVGCVGSCTLSVPVEFELIIASVIGQVGDENV